MPRPPDTYTHSQFEPIDSEHNGDTVRCVHCKQWSGSVKTLNRKKDHLLKCRSYREWRAAGNGQDLPPPNTYNKRESLNEAESDTYNSPYQNTSGGPSLTPTLVRHKNIEFSKYFDEYPDETAGQKCMRVRCRYCGFVRAKNTTRQVEHLTGCKSFLDSSEGQEAKANGDLQQTPADSANGPDIWRGGAPNPNLSISRRGQNKPRGGMNVANSAPYRPPPPAPSLVSYLLSRVPKQVTRATQNSFLSHAGCGTLSASALDQWLAQEIHISRALVPFVGSLIGKIRIPETGNLQQDPTYRSMDLLISAVQNMKKELEFLEGTKRKYGLHADIEEPKPAVKGIVDLFAAATSPQAGLLEGIVVLWSIEHFFSQSFQYASNFITTIPSQSNYSLPSYLASGQVSSSTMYGTSQPNRDSGHIAALRESLIPNWTSVNFIRFVDACKAIVDELANSQTTGNGRAEMFACERMFKQAVWLWGQSWPEVDGMGEEDELAAERSNTALAQPHNEDTVMGHAAPPTTSNVREKPLEGADDEDAEGTLDSPFGGTGLGAVAAAMRVA